MASFSIKVAEEQFAELIARAEAGEELTITRDGVPVAMLISIEPAPARRVPGQDRGRIRVSDQFDAPLPPDLQHAFEA